MSIINNNNGRNPSTCPIKEGNNIIFYINLSGFPLAEDALAQMWDYAKELQPDAADQVEDIRERDDYLPDISIPTAPFSYIYNKKFSNYEKVEKIQRYIDELQYNHTGLQFFDIRKDRPLVGLVDVAKKIIDDSLPIKCLEAVILSIYLTNEIGNIGNNYVTGNLEKFTIGFKTSSNSNIHRHVVLGIYCHVTGMFGALGTSRRSDLGYKTLNYRSLTDLLLDFVETYGVYLHKVRRVKIGMPLPYSNRSFESIQWNGCTINMSKCTVPEWSKICEKHARVIRLNGLNTGMTNTGPQSTSLSVRNLNKIYSKSDIGTKTKVNKSQEIKKVDSSLSHRKNSGNMILNDESCSSFENKIINDINEQDSSKSTPLINSQKSDSHQFHRHPSALQLRSSLNTSQQSYQTNNSSLSMIKDKKTNKSLRI